MVYKTIYNGINGGKCGALDEYTETTKVWIGPAKKRGYRRVSVDGGACWTDVPVRDIDAFVLAEADGNKRAVYVDSDYPFIAEHLRYIRFANFRVNKDHYNQPVTKAGIVSIVHV